ncbi:MAG: DNA-binding response regulator [Anaerolineae bacterium]|nr:MAG: DNA-binding response regulator [Anaerolineae bacterium]
MTPLKVLIVDDHPLFRQGVGDTLRLERDFDVVGEAADGDQALEMIRTLQPDVVVLDVHLPGKNGLQITRQVQEEKLATRVVLVTAYDDVEQLLHALRAGAAAYCPKHVQPEELLQVLRHVGAGKFVFNGTVLTAEQINPWVEEYLLAAISQQRELDEPLQPLSSREMDVLGYVTQGMSNKEIAAHLGISYQTVKNHVTAILRKLNVEDRTQAAVYAIRRGWFQLHDNRASRENHHGS